VLIETLFLLYFKFLFSFSCYRNILYTYFYFMFFSLHFIPSAFPTFFLFFSFFLLIYLFFFSVYSPINFFINSLFFCSLFAVFVSFFLHDMEVLHILHRDGMTSVSTARTRYRRQTLTLWRIAASSYSNITRNPSAHQPDQRF
jgi:hypothetical protein